jgi:hypothetical protein
MTQGLVNKFKHYYWHLVRVHGVHVSRWGLKVCSTVVDPDPPWSTLISVGWIGIRNADQDLDSSSQK